MVVNKSIANIATIAVENGIRSISSSNNEEEKKNKYFACLKSNLLTILTVFGVFAGVGLGFILRNVREEPWSPREISYVNFLGDVFLRMLKGLILPLIVSSLISAIGSLDLTLSRKIGGRAIAYYLVTTICAVILGIILVTTIKPGVNGSAESENPKEIRKITTVDTLLDLVR